MILVAYLIKCSIGLGVVYLFYYLFLRRLTFYSVNRWYLLLYTALAFLFPFIDITALLRERKWEQNNLVHNIPTVRIQNWNVVQHNEWSADDWILLIVVLGVGLMIVRLMVQFISYLKIRRAAKLIYNDGVKIYNVNKPLVPFSFGKSIFVNLGSETDDIKQIIRHEFVHVREKHTLDIIFSEIICVICWYNPAAWLLRKAIRQNLEFIADKRVLESGVNRKQYQYLLLKVLGQQSFSIATNFNISSLKKRIAMMNKIRSARVHLIRLFLLLPVVAVLILAFRNNVQSSNDSLPNTKLRAAQVSEVDTIDSDCFNEKGFCIVVISDKVESFVIVFDRNKNVVEKIKLAEWKGNKDKYVEKYGDIVPPPPPPPPDAPPPPPAPKLPVHVKKIHIKDQRAEVELKNGNKETYDLNDTKQKTQFEKKYGPVIEPALPPTAPVVSLTAVEAYDPTGKPVITVAAGGEFSVDAVEATPGTAVSAVTPGGAVIASNPSAILQQETLLVISKKTTKDKLSELVNELREKGYALKFKNMNFNNGVLQRIEGSISDENSTAVFNAKDFSTVVITIFTSEAGKRGFLVLIDEPI